MKKIDSKLFLFLIRLNPDSFITQSALTCSTLTVETVEQGVKYVQS